MANRHHKRRRQPCATRQRRLLIEQFEPRTLLATAAPSGVDATVTSLEDTAYTLGVADFGFSDSLDSPKNNFAAVKISALPSSGALYLGADLLSIPTVVPEVRLANGELKFVPLPSVSGLSYASFGFQVQDDGGTANGGSDLDPTPNTISINVLAVNDPPASRAKALSYVYGGGRGFTFGLSSFEFTDLGELSFNTLLAVRIATLPAAGVLSDNGVSVVAGQYISTADISSGLLRYQPNVVGNPFVVQDAFTLQVQDDGGTANGGNDLDPLARTISLTGFSFIGDSPVAAANKTATMLEDHQYTFSLADFDFSSPQDGSSVSSITVQQLPASGFLRFSGIPVTAGMTLSAALVQSGRLEYLPNINANGSPLASFLVTVQDSVATSDFPYKFGLNVIPVNDAPTANLNAITTAEDTPYTFAASDFGFNDFVDSPVNNFYIVQIITPPPAGLLTDGGVPVRTGDVLLAYDVATGKLKFTPAANANGTAYASIGFKLRDDGDAMNGGIDTSLSTSTITINVTSVNDPPSGIDNYVTVRDCGAFTFSHADFGFTDRNDYPNPDPFIGVKIIALPTLGTLSVNGIGVTPNQFVPAADISSGRLRLTLPTRVVGALGELKFQVQDSGGTANGGVDLDPTPNSFTFSAVPPPNTVGLFPINKTFTTNEDQPYVFRAEDFPLNDWYSDSLKSVTFVGAIQNGGRLKNNGIDVVVNQSVPVADIVAGRLTYLPPPNQTGIGIGSLSFRVLGDGGACTSFSATTTDETATFNVTAVNDPPSGADATVTTLEDTAYVFRETDFGLQDINDHPPNTLQAVKITTLPANGALTINGQSVALGQLIAAADIQASKLKFTPAANANGSSYASFTFQVQDDGGTANAGADLDSTPNTMTISVTPVNDPPAGASHNLFLGCGSFTFTPSDFGYSDPNDSPANNLLSVRLTNTGPGTLALNGAPYTNNTEVTFSQLYTGKLSYTPIGFNPTTITFVLKDDGGTANGGVDVDQTVRVMNITQSGAPATSPAGMNSYVTTNEDIPYTFKITDFRFIDAEANNLKSITIGSPLPSQGALQLFNGFSFYYVTPGQKIDAIDITMGRLVFFPLPVNGNSQVFAQLLFKVQDDGGTGCGGTDYDSTYRPLTISVNSVNDPPEGADKNIRVLNGQPRSFAVADFGLNDPNDFPADNLLALRVNSLPATGNLTNNGAAVAVGQSVPAADIAAGKFVFTPAADQPALASFEFQVQDDGGTANGGIDLDPTPNAIYLLTQPNHAPDGIDKTITLQEDSFGRELTLADFLLTDAGDAHADSLKSFTILSLPTVGRMTFRGKSVSIGQVVTPSDLTFGRLVFVPTANESGVEYAKFTYQIQDDGGTANGGVDFDPTPNTITFNVLSVNDPPSFNHLSGNYSATDETPQTHGPAGQQCIPGWATDIIPGPADESDQTVSFIVTSTNPNLFSAQPKVNADGSLCYTPKANVAGTATIGVTLQDNLGGTSQKVSFQIQITKPHPLHNTLNRYDVSGSALSPELDGIISDGDVLTGINYINAKGPDPIPPNTPPGPPYPDVNADNSVAPDDVLEIINWINAHPEPSEAPGNAAPIASDTSATNPPDIASQPAIYADLLNMLAADAASTQLKRRRLAN